MESDSIMLEAPALSAWRVGAMLIPSAGVYPCLHSPSTHQLALTRRVAPPQREHRFIMGCALHSQRLCYTFIFTAHTTHTLPPATLQPAAARTPCHS